MLNSPSFFLRRMAVPPGVGNLTDNNPWLKSVGNFAEPSHLVQLHLQATPQPVSLKPR